MIEVTMGSKARTSPALAALLLVFAACASSPSGPKANVPEPEFAIVQAVGPADAGYPYGRFEVKYRFDIANHANVPLTLKRITISTVNPEGGAYVLVPPHDYYFNKTIGAKATDAVEFWAKAYGYGPSPRDTEPVTIKGVVYFDSPSGYVNQVFIRELLQLR